MYFQHNMNPLLKMGLVNFAREAAVSGITAVLVVDLPPEEAQDYQKIVKEAGLKTVFLASPTTPQSRLSLIDAATTGFIYYISRTGVTGEQAKLSETLHVEVQNLKKNVQKQVAIGFGISTAEQARAVSKLGDAVVVGSAFVRLASQPDAEQALDQIRKLAHEISAAIA